MRPPPGELSQHALKPFEDPLTTNQRTTIAVQASPVTSVVVATSGKQATAPRRLSALIRMTLMASNSTAMPDARRDRYQLLTGAEPSSGEPTQNGRGEGGQPGENENPHLTQTAGDRFEAGRAIDRHVGERLADARRRWPVPRAGRAATSPGFRLPKDEKPRSAAAAGRGDRAATTRWCA